MPRMGARRGERDGYKVIPAPCMQCGEPWEIWVGHGFQGTAEALCHCGATVRLDQQASGAITLTARFHIRPPAGLRVVRTVPTTKLR